MGKDTGNASGDDITEAFLNYFHSIRKTTENICDPLQPEDFVIQSGFDVSPPKWHLAHTTWFFETFILKKLKKGYREFDKAFAYLYNSYYETVGEFFPKSRRGTVSRPDTTSIMEYRKHVDDALVELILNSEGKLREEVEFLTTVGVNHEQQHQELLLMDIKHNLFSNPGYYPYAETETYTSEKSGEIRWVNFEGGIREIGFTGYGFSFDNELPRHKRYLEPFQLADRPVTNREFLDFINDGGYRNPELWLSDGWHKAREEDWQSPLYWVPDGDQWKQFTLSGLIELNGDEPVSHLSYYEADAYARWSMARLPTEFEWEIASGMSYPSDKDNFMDAAVLRPTASYEGELKKMFGDVWEWTSSSYLPYPGFKPLEGSLGEYNGKFMSGQMVLRGGSCFTPLNHIRRTYRNFFAPEKRWPVTGLRLARDRK